jgi:hypothetical protein
MFWRDLITLQKAGNHISGFGILIYLFYPVWQVISGATIQTILFSINQGKNP